MNYGNEAELVVDDRRCGASTCILVLGLDSTQQDCARLGPIHGLPIHRLSLAGHGLFAKSNVKISSQELVPLYPLMLHHCSLKGQKQLKV